MKDANLFIVVTEDDVDEDDVEIAGEILDSVYKLDDRVVLIRDSILTDTDLVARLFGLVGSEEGEEHHGEIGIVFRLNGSHSGYHYEKLWDWLKEARGQHHG